MPRKKEQFTPPQERVSVTPEEGADIQAPQETSREQAVGLLIRAKTRVDEFAGRPKLRGVDLEAAPEEIRARLAELEKEAYGAGAVFEDAVREICDPKVERMMPHPEEKTQSKNAAKPLREKMVDKIYRVLEAWGDSIKKRAEDTDAPDRIKEIAVWLPAAVTRFEMEKSRINNIIGRAEREGKSIGAFLVDFQFAATKPSQEVAGLEDAYLEYGIEKLRELGAELGIDFQKFGEEATDLEEIIAESQTKEESVEKSSLLTVSLPRITGFERLRNALRRSKEIIKIVGAGIASVALAPLASAAQALGLTVGKMVPQRFLRKLEAAQIPGIPSFGSMMEIPVMRRSEEGLEGENPDRKSLFSSTQMFRHYDVKHDAFIAEKEPVRFTRYETSVDQHSELGKATLRLEGHVDINEFTLQSVELADRDPKTGFIPIPRPFGFGDALMLPLRAEAIYIETEGEAIIDKKIIDLPLHFDQYGQLWVDSSPLHPTQEKVTIMMRYGSYVPPREGEESVLTSFAVRSFIKQNPEYFRRTIPPLDRTAAAMELELPPDLETLMIKLEQSKLTASEKVVRLRQYMTVQFGYGKGFRAALRIATARGKNSVERIANAHEGVCFDTNKLAYILLARLGISAEMHVGYGSGSWRDDDVKARYEVSGGGEFVNRERARAFADITTKHGHAFLRYWDADAGVMRTADFTASDSLADIRWSRRNKALRDLVRSHLEEEYGFPSQEMMTKEQRQLAHEINSRLMPFYQITHDQTTPQRYGIGRDGFVTTFQKGWKPLFIGFVQFERAHDPTPLPQVTDPYKGGRKDVGDFIQSHIERSALFPFAESFEREGVALMEPYLERLRGAAEIIMQKLTRTRKDSFSEELRPFFRDAEEKRRSEFTRFQLRPDILVRYFFTRYLPQLRGPDIGFDSATGSYTIYRRSGEIPNVPTVGLTAEDISKDMQIGFKLWQSDAERMTVKIETFVAQMENVKFDLFEDALLKHIFGVGKKPLRELSPAEGRAFDMLRHTFMEGVVPKGMTLTIDQKDGRWIFRKKPELSS